jgi:hypothetical protein
MLRHSPRLTPASLAARRANALKSTGPRRVFRAACPAGTGLARSSGPGTDGAGRRVGSLAEADQATRPAQAAGAVAPPGGGTMSPGGWSVGPRSRENTRTDVGGRGETAISSLPSMAYFAPVARKARIDARCQTWNVDSNQWDGGIFAKVMEITRTVFTKPAFFEFRIPLIRSCLNDYLAYMSQSTETKTRKNTLFQTPTASSAFLFEINNIPGMCGLAPKRKCPLESSKRGLHVQKN